ncbi:MAG: hypothetical protein ACYTGR_12245 [Planctomycetota bacterium]
MARHARKSPLRPFAYLVQACSLLVIVRCIEADCVHAQMASNADAVARPARCLGGPRSLVRPHGRGGETGNFAPFLGALVHRAPIEPASVLS